MIMIISEVYSIWRHVSDCVIGSVNVFHEPVVHFLPRIWAQEIDEQGLVGAGFFARAQIYDSSQVNQTQLRQEYFGLL
jgi:hypothetical protein